MLRVSTGFLLAFFPTLFAQAAPAKSSGVWLEVPYVKQTEDGCGSAAIAMLLQYWSAHGTPVAAGRADATAIQKQLYSRKARGIFASDMQRYLRESGFREFAIRGEWSDLRQHLEQGRPLIISIQPGSAKRCSSTIRRAGNFCASSGRNSRKNGKLRETGCSSRCPPRQTDPSFSFARAWLAGLCAATSVGRLAPCRRAKSLRL